MRGILDANAAVIRRGRPAAAYGETIEYFLQQGYTSSDIDLLSARLPEKLKFLRVQLESKPAYEAEHVIDEEQLKQELDRKIGYRNKDALLHDVDCISAVARLRRRHRAHSVETCRALFVTTNSELVRTTRAFLRSIGFGALVLGTLLTFPKDFPAVRDSWVRLRRRRYTGRDFPDQCRRRCMGLHTEQPVQPDGETPGRVPGAQAGMAAGATGLSGPSRPACEPPR